MKEKYGDHRTDTNNTYQTIKNVKKHHKFENKQFWGAYSTHHKLSPLPSKSTNPIYFKHPFPQIQRALIGNIIDKIYTK